MLPLLLLELRGRLGDVLEGDCALDLLARKDGLVVPAYKDADVTRKLGGHGCGAGRGWGAEPWSRDLVVGRPLVDRLCVGEGPKQHRPSQS